MYACHAPNPFLPRPLPSPQVKMVPKDWLKEIAAGTTLRIGFGFQGSAPTGLQFTQILPLLDPNNDPSLKTRGTFPAKVGFRGLQPCSSGWCKGLHRAALEACSAAAPKLCAIHMLAFCTSCSVLGPCAPDPTRATSPLPADLCPLCGRRALPHPAAAGLPGCNWPEVVHPGFRCG